MNTFGNIPDFILVEIFSYLSKKELMKIFTISKRWNRLCYDRYLWQDVDMEEFTPIHVEDDTVLKLLYRSKSLHTLSLRGCYQVTDNVLQSISICGSKLKLLNIENCFKITDRSLIIVARHCSKLKTVNISNTLITEKGLSYLLKENHGIEDLTASPSAVTENVIQILATNCKDLVSLHAEHNAFTPCLVDRSSKKQEQPGLLTSKMIETLASNCKMLQVLIMKYHTTCISDKSIALLGYQCRNLECVEIGHVQFSTAFSDAGVSHLCSALATLRRLDLTETFITDMTLCTISNVCSSLEHLSFQSTGSITDIGILNIMRGCTNLESFSIHSGINGFITDLSIFAIAQSACACNLIQISLNSWNITDTGLFLLAQNLPNLMYLSLKGCVHLTHNGLMAAIKSFRNLEHLNLAFTKCVKTDEELFELSERLSNKFQSIHLETGNDISMAGCINFQMNIPDCEIIFCSS